MKYFVYIALVAGVSQAIKYTDDWATDDKESY